MIVNTERDAYDVKCYDLAKVWLQGSGNNHFVELILWANQAGRRGNWVRNIVIIPPRTVTGCYQSVLEEYRPATAGDMEP